MTTIPSADLNRAIAQLCGWRVDHPNGHWYRGQHECLSPGQRIDYCSDIAAAFTLCEHAKDRFDVLISRHNASHWKVEFCEPSHETVEYDESLALAICRVFLRTHRAEALYAVLGRREGGA